MPTKRAASLRSDPSSTTSNGSSRPRGRPRNDALDRPSADGILDCAERVFAENGFCNTSLRNLIEASRMSTTAFYARFASKDEVLAALLMRLVTSLGEAFVATRSHAASAAEELDVAVDLIVDALARHRDVARIALGEGAGSERVRDALLDGYRHLTAILGDNVQAGDHDDTDAIAWAVVGALQMQVVRWAVFDELDDHGLRQSLRTTARTLLPSAA